MQTEIETMYKYQDTQIQITDFGMPMGVTLSSENRWVKKAQTIPWEEIEEKYAALFKSETGNVAKPLRLALGALIIQTERRISDEEIVMQIQETPCLQYFCGLPEYKDEPPFEASSMVHFRKRLTKEILGEINELIIEKATKPPENDNKTDPPPNKGDLIVDSTCAPQNIRFPQDLSLLNEARENLEGMIDELHDSADGEKPRTYRKNARKDFLKTAKKRHKTAKQIRKAIGKQLRYIKRDVEIVEKYLKNGRELRDWYKNRFETIKILYSQQLFMYENRTHQINDRIVSLGQPWIRPIVRGKAKSKCEFGIKLDISVSNGFTRLEYTSFDAYNESENLIEIIERYKKRTGFYPKRVLVDQIFRNRDNIAYCAKNNIRISGKPLGRPRRDIVIDKKQARMDEIDRIEVERKFSHAKGSFGLGLIRAKLKQTSETAIALSIVALNIAQIGCVLCAIFWKWFGTRKIAVVQ